MLVNEVNATRGFTVLKLEKQWTHWETGLVGRGGRWNTWVGYRRAEEPPSATQGHFLSVGLCLPLVKVKGASQPF